MSMDSKNDHNFDPAILDKLKQLEEKYAAMGQDLSSYLDGLLYADYRTYWDLIHLDTLLSLQRPQTPIPTKSSSSSTTKSRSCTSSSRSTSLSAWHKRPVKTGGKLKRDSS